MERAVAVKPDFAVTDANAPALAEICRRLDGLPLAIELAAARIRMLSPEAMLARLGHGLSLLAGGRRDVPARQQTLRNAIAWSYDLLASEEQTLFRRLGVFVGGFTLDAVEAVCDGGASSEGRGVSEAGAASSAPTVGALLAAPDTETLFTASISPLDPHPSSLDLLESLVSKSLVKQQASSGAEPRYGMLETIRDYALERLEQSGETATVRWHHFRWCSGFAERTGATAVSVWLDRLTIEHDNLRAALSWSLAGQATDDDARAGLRLATALTSFWLDRDHLGEGRQWLEQALARDQVSRRDDVSSADLRSAEPGTADGTSDTLPFGAWSRRSIRVAALNSLAMLAFQQQEIVQSNRCAEEAVQIARSLDDPVGAAHALTALSQNARMQGRYRQAVTFGEEALTWSREAGNSHDVWRGLINLSDSISATGDHERARELLDEALTLARERKNEWGVGNTFRLLGRLAYWQGDLGRATDLLEESMVWWNKVGATRGLHWSLHVLGLVALAQGDLRRATHRLCESLALCREAGDRWGTARCLEGLASVAVAPAQDGSLDGVRRAARLLGAAEVLREVVGARLYPTERIDVDRAAATAGAQLGEAGFAAVWAEGRAMGLEDAIAYALEASEPADDD